EDLRHLDRICAAEPAVAGIEVDAEMVRIAEAVHDLLETGDRAGQRPVRLEEQRHAVVLRDTKRFVQLLDYGEYLLILRKLMAERGRGLPLGRDDIFDTDRRRCPYRLDDLRRAIPPRRRRIEQIRMRAIRRNRQPLRLEHPPQ